MTNTKKTIEETKPYDSNSRIVPTENKIIESKTFSMETYLKLQIESSWTQGVDTHRYIKLESINYTQWAKDLGVTAKTLRKNIQMLDLVGALTKYRGSDGLMYYKIVNNFSYYKLFNEKFIRKLLNIGSKNLVKIYIVYYKYSMEYGACLFEQKDILKQIGFNNASSKNIAMLKDINDTLCDLGLIEIEKKIRRKDGRTRTLLKIVALNHSKTKFYRDAMASY